MDERLTSLRELREAIRREILDRVELSQCSVPVRSGGFEYYSRTEDDRPYAIHCRGRLSAGSSEEIVVDENILADGKSYFSLEFLRISPDHTRCLFGIDAAGDERPMLYVRELDRPGANAFPVASAIADAAWANDNRTFFAVRLDEINRPSRLVCHVLDLDIGPQRCAPERIIFDETDPSFQLRLVRTESGRFIVLTSWAHDTTELHILSADEPDLPLRLLHGRRSGVEVYATHHGNSLYLLTNEDAPGKTVVSVPEAEPSAAKTMFLDARPGVEISSIQAFAKHLVVYERHQGLQRIRVVEMESGEDHLVTLPNSVCALMPEDNSEFDTSVFRFGYDSLTTPYTVYDYDMADRRLQLRQQTRVKGYRPDAYHSERLLVTTADGAHVPLSLVYRRDAEGAGRVPSCSMATAHTVTASSLSFHHCG